MQYFLYVAGKNRVVPLNNKHAAVQHKSMREYLGATELTNELLNFIEVPQFIEGTDQPRPQEEIDRERELVVAQIRAMDLPKIAPQAKRRGIDRQQLH